MYWISFFVNVFTNVCCGAFYWFTHKTGSKYADVVDPATGGKLEKRSKRLELGKVLELPWSFWLILSYGLFTTGIIVIFNGNATEFAEQRFQISAVTAGWYAVLAKDAAFILNPFVGIFIDWMGNRVTFSKPLQYRPGKEHQLTRYSVYCGSRCIHINGAGQLG